MVSDEPAELGAEGNIARNAQFSLPHERHHPLLHSPNVPELDQATLLLQRRTFDSPDMIKREYNRLSTLTRAKLDVLVAEYNWTTPHDGRVIS